MRLAGFSAELCGPTGFCLVLDGATGGNNAFAMLALLDVYEKFGDDVYLDDARTIGRWIVGLLTDETGAGFGGYYLGYPDEGVPPPKPLVTGKSIENVADIFVAFTRLAEIEARLGNAGEAEPWTERAYVAGDFVMEMFDDVSGCFFAGTVPEDTAPTSGILPVGEPLGGEIRNGFLFLDANTFTTMALAESPRYRDQIDWRRPVHCVLDRFQRMVNAGGRAYSGFSIDQVTAEGPAGIAWEFTAQAIVLMRLVDALYEQTGFEADALFYLEQIAVAQAHAPFGDGLGLVASTLEDGEALAPLEQCLTTPFQCIAQRVGLAATAWAILAERNVNPLSPAPRDLACTSTATTLCLNNGRFKIEVNWETAAAMGMGQVVPGGTGDSSNLYFFSPNNWEMLIKVLDGCTINDRYWVFFAATTDVELTVIASDTSTGQAKHYFNPLGHAANAVTDTSAFDTCP